MRFIISCAILLLAVRYRRYFLLFIPFLQYAGFFLMTENRAPELNFIICYAELVILLIFAVTYSIKDNVSCFLLLYPLLSLPSIVMATGNFYQSIFLTTLLCMTAFAYRFYLDKMQWLLKINIFHLIIIVWILYGVATKIHEELKYGAEFAGHLAPGVYTLMSRSGGLGAGNHLAGIILLFLPFVKDYRIIALSSIFLLTIFSRGVYFLLLLYGAIMVLNAYSLKKMKKSLFFFKAIIVSVCLITVAWSYMPSGYEEELFRSGLSRMFDINNNSVQGIKWESLHDASRMDMRDQATRIFKETYFQGIGLGGFYWGQGLIGEFPEFSNAHNLYLTSLCEGGVFFAIAFIGLLAYMALLAIKNSKEAFFSLIIFIIYGFFSGEIYSTSGLASACSYYYLIFIFAYIKFIERSRRASQRIPCALSNNINTHTL